MSIPSQIKSEIELKQKIYEQAGELLLAVRQDLGSLENEYKQARKEQIKGVALFILAFLIGDPFKFLFGNWGLVLSAPIVLTCLFYGFKLTFGKFHVIKQYQVAVDRVLFAKTFSLLGVEGNLLNRKEILNQPFSFSAVSRKSIINFSKTLSVNQDAVSQETLEVLNLSELITEEHNTNQVDTGMEIKWRGLLLKVAELDIEHVTGSSKNRNTKQIFHGYFASFKLGRELAGKTFVSTEGDTHGFGQISFWNKGGATTPKETILEWNDFENMLHVATTDESEARYVLTPDFMLDLYEWWKEHKTNIRVSFIKDQAFILFPDEQVRIGETVRNLTEEKVVDYVYTIARPLWHIMRLAEKVKL